MKNLYNKYILPKVTHKVCSLGSTMKQRPKVIPQAFGRVLEIGIGSGLNYEFYDTKRVEHLFGLEPSQEMLDIATEKVSTDLFPLDLIKGFAEQIPLDDNTVDCIIVTYTLCTISDVPLAFDEIRRVLKPKGNLIFCEHGKAPEKNIQFWQDLFEPAWKSLGGGCHLNRDIPELIKQGGFELQKLDTMYIPGFKPACFNYWGSAINK